MITKVAFLFLLGTTMGSNLFMDRLKTAPHEITLAKSFKNRGCPTGAELTPLICKFMQPYLDMYYKPQLIAPSTYIPPLVVEKCGNPGLKMDLVNLPEPNKSPLVFPRPLELAPFTISKFPVPVIVEEHPAVIGEHYESSDIEEMPVAHIPAAPQLPAFEMPVIPEIVEQTESFTEGIPEIDHNNIDEKDVPPPPKVVEKPGEEPSLSEVVASPEIDYNKYEPISIPQPPELPAFVMPEFPVVASHFENKPISIPVHSAPLAHIPAPPELPFTIPKFPVPVIVEEHPVRISEHYESSDIQEMPAMHIPAAPQLPAFEMPVIPEIVEQTEPFTEGIPEIDQNNIDEKDVPPPPKVVEKPGEEPSLSEVVASPEIDYNKYEPISIPQPPELPAFVMPEFPVVDSHFENKPISIPVHSAPLAHIPAPPELPFTIPKFPVPVIVEEHPVRISEHYESSDMPVMHIPAAPQLPAFEMPVIPEMVGQTEPVTEATPEIDHNKIDEKDIPSPPKVVQKPGEEPSLSEVVASPEIDYNNYEHISIPQSPELPAFVMPEYPLVNSYFEDTLIPISEHFAPLAHMRAPPELPSATLPEYPAHDEIPSGFVLPFIAFAPPSIAEQPLKEPYLTEVIPDVDQNLVNYQHTTIPQAPKLPEFVMPELPTISIETLSAHVLPAMDIPSPPVNVEHPDPLTMLELPVRIQIPSAPVPTTEILSPPMIIEQPAEGSYHEKAAAAPETDYSIIKSTPISIPAPPELPTFVMPEIPIRVVEEPFPGTEGRTPDIPTAPKLSEIVMSAPPSTFVGRPCESSEKSEAESAVIPHPFERYFGEKVKESHNIMIPAAMNRNYYPSPCVYNLVMQHIVPNIASNHFRSLEKVRVLPPSYIPCA